MGVSVEKKIPHFSALTISLLRMRSSSWFCMYRVLCNGAPVLATERTVLRVITIIVIGKTNYEGEWLNFFFFFNSSILVEKSLCEKDTYYCYR